MKVAGALAVLMLVASTAIAEDTGVLKGRATDTYGAPISRAFILLHLSSSVRRNYSDVHVTTDDEGRFTVPLPEGFYDVFVARTGFEPKCQKVQIQKGKTTEYRLKLGVSRIELTDTVE